MARIRIPKNVGPYVIVIAMAENYAVTNNRKSKNRVWVVCRDRAHAEELVARLNAGEHGEVWM